MISTEDLKIAIHHATNICRAVTIAKKGNLSPETLRLFEKVEADMHRLIGNLQDVIDEREVTER